MSAERTLDTTAWLSDLLERGDLVGSLHGIYGDYLAVTPSVEQLLGAPPGQVVGRSPYEFFHPDDLRDLEARHRDMVTCDGTTTVVDYRLRRAEGDYLPVRGYGWAHPEDNGDVRIVGLLVRRDALDRTDPDRLGTLALEDVLPVVRARVAKR